MSLFLFSKVKKLFLLLTVIILIFAVIFGYYYYQYTPDYIKNSLIGLYQSDSNYYLIQGLLFIFIHTYLSTSYIGFIGSGFLTFIKGIQIIYSILYINNQQEFTLLILLSLCLRILIDVLSSILITVQAQELSYFMFYSIFLSKTEISIKKLTNNYFNIIIFGLVVMFVYLNLT